MTFRREDRDLLYVNGVVRWTPRIGERVRLAMRPTGAEHIGMIEDVLWGGGITPSLHVRLPGKKNAVVIYAHCARPYNYSGELSMLEIVLP